MIKIFSHLYIKENPSKYAVRLLRYNNTHKDMPVNHTAPVAIDAVGIGKAIVGFTLSEVLITLTIVGLVAALTIPSLLQNTQDQHLRTRWKETFSILKQASSRVLQDHGDNFPGLCGNTDSICLKNLYVPYLSISKDCSTNAVGNCWVNLGTFYMMDGTVISNWSSHMWPTTPAGIILSNGAYVMFSQVRSNCNIISGSVSACGGIDVDVNGPKGPNTEGKDLFQIWQLRNGINPVGIPGDGYETNCGLSTHGWGCGAIYLRQ